MITEIPLHVRESAQSDLGYMLNFVNADSDLDAELIQLEIEIEDGEDTIFDVSVRSTISFGYDPRQHIEFEFDYYVDGELIKFWNNGDINTLANELKNRIDFRKKVRR